MRRKSSPITGVLVTFFACLLAGQAGLGYEATVKFSFYTNDVELAYSERLMIAHRAAKHSANSAEFYQKMDVPGNQPFLDSLLAVKSRLKLNDWLFYKLIEQAGKAIYPDKSKDYRALFCWYVLQKCGYDAILAYGRDIFIYAHAPEKLYGVMYVVAFKKRYVCISHWVKGAGQITKLDGYCEQKYSKGKAFDFALKEVPVLAGSKLATRKVSFYSSIAAERFEVAYSVNETYLALLKEYPLVSFQRRMDIPVSDALRNSLLPQLRKIIAGRDTVSALRMLLSFSRSVGDYKVDEESYGEEIWFTAEEALNYHYLDCEDYSAVLYFLNKELLGLASIIIYYPDLPHVNLGMRVNREFANTLKYKGVPYVVCEPTGTGDFGEVGESTVFRKHKYVVEGAFEAK